MPRPLSFKKLKKHRENLSQARRELENKTLSDLQSIREQLRDVISSIKSWLKTLARGKKKILPKNKYLIEQMDSETNDLEAELHARMEEIKDEQRLHREWEVNLLPEPNEEGILVPNYPMRSSYESDDLISETDDSWLPVDRWHPSKTGATR